MPLDQSTVGILIPLGAFVMVAIIVWVASNEKQAKARYRAEVQKELIAKFGSGRELSEFLNSEGSRHLLGALGSPREDPQQDPRHKVIGMITGGLICASIGGAFFYIGMSWGFPFLLVGLIMLGVGGSLLISAGISYYLSKKWGLDQPTGGDLPRSS
ncbi:MAG: hypothetical protein WD733_18390 [Bryobacterales bacterium]